LGTAIKARALLCILNNYSHQRKIITEVLDENEAMKRINEKLGFIPKSMQATIEFTLMDSADQLRS